MLDICLHFKKIKMSATTEHVDVEILDDDSEKARVCLRAGQSIVSVKPVFSHDGKCLFCVSGTSVKIFSTSGGGCIRELKGHTQAITDICLNPKNKLQILTCSTDGWIKQWDYSDGVILRKFNLETPVYGIICFLQTPKLTVAVVQKKQQKKAAVVCELVKYVLSDWSEGVKQQPTVLLENCSSNRKYIDMGAEDEFIAAIWEKSLTIINLKKEKKTHFESADNCFTHVICHPTDRCIVIGDEIGKIHYWWNFWKPSKTVRTSYHWHSLPVKCLEFTAEGTNLLSGGHECVLVKWQYNSNSKDFLPRLGSPLNHITCSPDNTIFNLSHDDNAIRLISNNYKPVCFYQGLTRGHLHSHVRHQASTGLLFDPHTKALVTTGRVGHLQFYNVHTDTQLFNLDITSQNYISPDTLSADSTATHVTNASFNYSGKWLATTEYWSAENLSPEIRMKFWIFNEEKQTYTLNTSVEFPHEQQVYWLMFRPQCVRNKDLLMVVTTCQDGCFKLWTAEDCTDLYGTVTKWMCETASSYRDLPAGQAQFTQDGSVLAVVFLSTVTLWDPDTNELKGTLHASMGDSVVNNICFGYDNCCQYLVTTSDQHITSWNLLSLSVHWTVNLKVSVLVADPFSNIMAAFSTGKQHLFVFEPSKSKPIYTHSTVSNTEVIGAVFIPHIKESSLGHGQLLWQKSSQLYFINTAQQLSTIAYEEDKKDENSLLSITQNLPKTPFGKLIAEKSVKDSVKHFGYLQEKKSSLVKVILKTSPHVQPPVTVLCNNFLQSLLISSKNNKTSEDLENEEEDEEMLIKSDFESDVEMETNTKTNHMDVQHKTIEKLQTVDMEKEKSEINHVFTEQFSWFSIKN